jgi:hypothetical protein
MSRKHKPGAGRPSLSPDDRRVSITFRADPKLRADLDREAAQNGRRLTTEIESRLRNSFDAFGEGPNRDLAVAIADIAKAVQALTGKNWREDRYSFLAVRSFAQRFLSDLEPVVGEMRMPEDLKRIADPSLGWDDPEVFGASLSAIYSRQLRRSWPPASLEDANARKYHKMQKSLGVPRDEEDDR